jgi:lipopolysaccharide export system protein LptA
MPKIDNSVSNHQIYFSVVKERMKAGQFGQKYLSPNSKSILIGRFVIEYLKGKNNGKVIVYDFSLGHMEKLMKNPRI